MKYEVGDRVKAKSLNWYNENKNKFGKVWTSGGQIPFDKCMSKWCGKVMTISDVRADHYTMIEDLVGYWTDEMIEGLVEEEMPLDKVGQITDFEYEGLAYTLPEGYQFVDENGNVINATKIVLEKKKKEYPKTIEECKDKTVAGSGYKIAFLLTQLERLLMCRDAYWKIAGEEMGLGKLWEPDWTDDNAKYSIYTIKGTLTKAISCYDGAILTFPTAEMRDAFYENFKELIEQCKELL